MVDVSTAITNITPIFGMIVDVATQMCDLIMTPPIVFVVGIGIALTGFGIVRSFFRRKV